MVEVNPRLEGTDLRVAGAFARDAQGTIHLCHNGRIGGGRHGVGKAAFFKHYRGDLTAMAHEERTISVVDLGPVRSPRLPARLGRFAREVLRVKRLITAPEKHSYAGPIATRQVLARKSKGFVPEFADFRTPYLLQDEVEAQAEHGLVVDALVESIEKLGYATQNDQMRGLYILDDNHRLMVLFEVKTDITRTSIYAAVGQLLLNGRIADEETRMVLGPVNTNGHDYGTIHGWKSHLSNTRALRPAFRCSAAMFVFRILRCSTPSCMLRSTAANGADCRPGLATGTPFTPG